MIAGNRVTEQPLELVHGAEHRGAEHEELHVLVRRVARVQEVVAEVVAHAPVEVLTGAVDAGERLLVEQDGQAKLGRDSPHHLHRHHLMVGGDVRVLEDRRNFVLARRHFVVACLDRNADLIQLALDFHHEREDAVGNRAEVLIFELLSLRRLCAEKRAARIDQVRALNVKTAIDQEVLLLRTAGRHDALRFGAEELEDADSLLGQRLHRAKERCLLVERLTSPADERGRDNEGGAGRSHEQPWRTRRIPGRVAARFEG